MPGSRPAAVGDREEPPPPSFSLALFGQQAQLDQARRLLVEEGVGERPEVADGRRHVAFEFVGRGWTFSLDQAEHEV